MSEHTPLPWHRDTTSGINCDVRAENGRKIALCWGLSTTLAAKENRKSYRDECDANARFIVEACNSYYDLRHDLARQNEIATELATENAELAARVKELEGALGDLASVCERNIYPKPDVGPEHPWSVLKRAQAALAKKEAGQ